MCSEASQQHHQPSQRYLWVNQRTFFHFLTLFSFVKIRFRVEFFWIFRIFDKLTYINSGIVFALLPISAPFLGLSFYNLEYVNLELQMKLAEFWLLSGFFRLTSSSHRKVLRHQLLRLLPFFVDWWGHFFYAIMGHMQPIVYDPLISAFTMQIGWIIHPNYAHTSFWLLLNRIQKSISMDLVWLAARWKLLHTYATFH